jgi:hypothetical protein
MSLALLFHYLLLNMFRMLVHHLQELATYCGFISWVVLLWFDVCWCYGVVRLGWCGILTQVSAGIRKNDMKNNTSDTINKIIPHRNPFVTIFVCNPLYVPSRVTSRHHWITVSTVITAPIPNKLSSYLWNHLIIHIKVVSLCRLKPA